MVWVDVHRDWFDQSGTVIFVWRSCTSHHVCAPKARNSVRSGHPHGVDLGGRAKRFDTSIGTPYRCDLDHHIQRPLHRVSIHIVNMSSSDSYDHATKVEHGDSQKLERLRTAGGHIDDRDQPSLPVVHRSLANPAPLGLLSFATGIFLISILGVHARGIQTPNVLIGVLMFFGGVCQFIAGIFEFVAGMTRQICGTMTTIADLRTQGNSFGATVFPSYAAFNFSYAMIYIPGTGILASYTDTTTGELRPEFFSALGM